MEEKDDLTALAEAVPGAVPEAGARAEDPAVRIRPETLPAAAAFLRSGPRAYSMLVDATCVDRPCRPEGRFELVYRFFSLARNRRLRLKAALPAGRPEIASLAALWKNGDWLEREIFDMFGVRFTGHPGLRRLFLDEGFEGHPLRKDFPLRGRQPLPVRRDDVESSPFVSAAAPESLLINMGPSHPAMHGTVRLRLELDGERVRNADVEVGYLHRGFEKTCESRTWFNLLIYTDRLNYVSPLLNNLGYATAVEKLCGLEVPERAQWIRVLLGELSRVSDHLTCLAAMAMETGAFTAFLYNMKAREFLWDVIEQTTGARMTTSYIRVGGVRADLHPGCEEAVRRGVAETRKVIKDVRGLLDKNPIFLGRTRDVAAMGRDDAVSHGWTGPALRSTGVAYDVRRAYPYLTYDRLSFDIPVGDRGDNYDRYFVRMAEMEQSLRIIEQCLDPLRRARPAAGPDALEPAEAIRRARTTPPDVPVRLSPNLEGAEQRVLGDIQSADPRFAFPGKEAAYGTIEGLIAHFQYFMKGHGLRPPAGEAYAAVEGGNGELGYYLVSDGTDRPYRLHLRAPCLHVVSALAGLIKGRLLADIIPTFGSMNMIGGELDR